MLCVQDFYRAFRAKEKTSFHAAKVFAMECFNILPAKVGVDEENVPEIFLENVTRI